MFKRARLSVTLFFLAAILASADVLAVTASEYAVVINLAGRQRMLTQKMSKEMLLVAKGIDAEANRAALAKTASLFDRTLKGLKDGDASVGLPPTESKVTRRQLGKVDGLWKEFDGLVQPVVNGGEVDVAAVAAQNLPLLKNMNACVRLYEKAAKKDTGKSAGVVINLAGKQRMLTQKMSKETLLIALGHAVDDNKSNLRNTASLFDRTLKGLKDGDADLELPKTDDPAIRAQLDTVDGLWQQFKPLVDQAGALDGAPLSDAELAQLAELNLPLLKEMNKAVKMYEQAAQ
jgi:nitrate/nitrite-specific signal transduction histidine kinase